MSTVSSPLSSSCMAFGFGDSAGAYLLTLADLQATTPTPVPQPTALPTATPTPTPAVLGTVVVNGDPVEGVIIRPGNGDHWQFEGQAQQVVTVSMQSLDRHLDPLLTLIDPDGLPLTANDDRRREDVNARIEGYVLPRSGTYRVWANGARDTYGVYTLSISAEPNLMPTPTLSPTPEATLVAQPGDNQGELSPGGHALWYWDGEAGQRVTIRVAAENPANAVFDPERRNALDTLVIVRGPDGLQVARADDIVIGVQTDSLIEDLVLEREGTYTIEVFSFNDRGAGAYTLTLEVGD